MFSHRNTHKYTSTSPDRKTQELDDHVFDHVSIDKKQHLIVADDQSFTHVILTIIW